MGGVMTQVDAAKFPHELVHIEVPPEMSQIDGALNEFGQREAPLTFHLEDLVPDAALDVVELKQTCRHRTASRQARPLRPSEPVANESLQARKTFVGFHRRLDNMRHREFRHMRQQFDLNVLFRSEVGEQPAFRHSDLVGQNSEGDAGQSRLAHQGQSLMEYPFARRDCGIRHAARKARPVVLCQTHPARRSARYVRLQGRSLTCGCITFATCHVISYSEFS